MAGDRAVLFDLDGTLTPRRASVRGFASLFAADFAEALAAMPEGSLADALVAHDHGGYNPRRALDLIEALPWRTPPSPAALDDYWQARFPDAVLPQPGLHEVLDALRADGFRVGVVTNGGVPAQTRKLERLDVADRVDDVVISEAVRCKKPDPAIFEIAVRGLGVAAEACWFVGDHPVNDVLGAQRFGMGGVWIAEPEPAFPWPGDEPSADHRIERLAELLALVGVA